MLPQCLIDDICLPVFENVYIVIIILLCLFIYVFIFLYILKSILSICSARRRVVLPVLSKHSGNKCSEHRTAFLLVKPCPSSLH